MADTTSSTGGGERGPGRPKGPPPAAKKKPEKRVVEIEVDPALGRRSSPEQLRRRQEQAYSLRLLGQTPEDIAAVFGVSARQVRKYISAAELQTITELRKMEGKAGVVRQFTVLNHVLDESLIAWEKSKGPKLTKTEGLERMGVSSSDVDDDSLAGLAQVKEKTGRKEEERIGDPVYLDKILKASSEIRALIGLDAPEVKRILLTEDPLVLDPEYEDLRTIPTEELLRRYRAKIGLGERMG